MGHLQNIHFFKQYREWSMRNLKSKVRSLAETNVNPL